MNKIIQLEGSAVPVEGNDIDTDRIIPARFLSKVEKSGYGELLFHDIRNDSFVLDQPAAKGASILVVGTNFGCGSSREHAPQGLVRFGIRAVIGESFSDIFQGNASMLGLPCFMADRDAVDRLQTLVESTPAVAINADIASGEITAGSLHLAATLPPAVRDGFLSGQWNPTAMLLARFDEVRAVADRLPYIRGF